MYKRRSCETRDTTKGRMGEYWALCAEETFLGVVRKRRSLQKTIYGSKTARNAFKKFQEFAVSSTDETSLCAIYRFDAVIIHAVDGLIVNAGAVVVPRKTHQSDQDKNVKVAHAEFPQKHVTRWTYTSQQCSGTKPSSSSCCHFCHRLWEQMFKQFEGKLVASGVDVKNELTIKAICLEIAWLPKGERQHTIAFKMPSNGHF